MTPSTDSEFIDSFSVDLVFSADHRGVHICEHIAESWAQKVLAMWRDTSGYGYHAPRPWPTDETQAFIGIAYRPEDVHGDSDGFLDFKFGDVWYDFTDSPRELRDASWLVLQHNGDEGWVPACGVMDAIEHDRGSAQKVDAHSNDAAGDPLRIDSGLWLEHVHELVERLVDIEGEFAGDYGDLAQDVYSRLSSVWRDAYDVAWKRNPERFTVVIDDVEYGPAGIRDLP